jgi:hypothetical protein
MEKKKMAKALMMTAALAGGMTVAQSFFSEAQASGGSGGSGWFWQSKTIKCSVTITYGGGPIPFSYAETFESTKTICEDGWSLCLATICS